MEEVVEPEVLVWKVRMMEAVVQRSGETEVALALRTEEERVFEMREQMVSYFQGVGVVSCQLAVVDLSLKPMT
jgi:hypothetical protein